ncbi:GMC family oxidoreductase [Fulvivirga sp. M361]|uniref:GMC oxidoreductase n=1 Tax=Fulvivirga sp. M361 TaxID=2594266 RepID=UPI00117AE904|nr:GMC oxidoreductase [Fulvivirga sp. M361]TRX60119.1 GMC family oxidoreductase [Fulvivirga sp. M361]
MNDDGYDLILVGTGFASIFFLKKYLEKKPKAKVLVLERGRLYSHANRLQDVIDKKDTASQTWRSKRSEIINPNSEKDWVFEPNFGGGSNCWTGCTPRFLESDFKLKTNYGIAVDWPVSYEELEPYYCMAEEIMAISGPADTPFKKSKKYPLPPHELSNLDILLKKKYGDLYISQPSARASSAIGNRAKCCSSSVCQLCPVNSKFTIENTLKYIVEKEQITIQYEAQVTHLELKGDLAGAVHYNSGNKSFKARGEVVALGANAIFNAHILLGSGDSNPFTGKGLTEQVGKYVWLYFDGLDNLGGSSVITANGYMMYDGDHRKERAACLIENHNRPFIRSEFGKWRQLAKLKFVYEDLPQDTNAVTLSEDKNKPLVDYHHHSPYVEKAIARLEKDVEKYFSFLPIERVEIDDRVQRSEAHILGTTRMSHDATTGVIDKHLIHHQYRNLFVLGGGSFPTISPANPTLTLSALSLLAADQSFS